MVLTIPNKTLRQKARKVTDFGANLQTLIDDMIKTMRDKSGIGLAAPQVGESLQIFVAEEAPSEKLFVVVNPKITRKSKNIVKALEGCLSVRGLVGDVQRFETIVVSGQSRHGKKMKKIKATGQLARIFQHEIDHLNGVLIIDISKQLYFIEVE